MKSLRTGPLRSASCLSACGEGVAGGDTQALPFQGRSRNFRGLREGVCVWDGGRQGRECGPSQQHTCNFQQCQFCKNYSRDIPFAPERCVLPASVPIRTTSPVPAQLSSGATMPRPGVQAPNTQETVPWPHGALSAASQPHSLRQPFHQHSLNTTSWSSGGRTSLQSSITKEQTSQHDS